ncbi:MAG: flagellar basal body P-ring formation chaperone FlgA [Pseudomonadales bacterium]
MTLRPYRACAFAVFISSNASAFTASEQITTAVKEFVSAESDAATPASVEKTEIQVNGIDSRLRLADCGETLTLALQNTRRLPGRNLVKVSCAAPNPWSIYVPANVVWYQTVVSSRVPLNKAKALTTSDVYLQQIKINRSGSAYYSRQEDVVGKLLKRRIAANQPLTAVLLEEADLVRKGDTVIMLAKAGGIAVRTEGEALTNGAAGEQIRVKNRGSKRIVKAEVTGRGQVKVLM